MMRPSDRARAGMSLLVLIFIYAASWYACHSALTHPPAHPIKWATRS